MNFIFNLKGYIKKVYLYFFVNNLYNVYVSAILRKCNFNVIEKNGKKVKNCLKYNHGSQFNLKE